MGVAVEQPATGEQAVFDRCDVMTLTPESRFRITHEYRAAEDGEELPSLLGHEARVDLERLQESIDLYHPLVIAVVLGTACFASVALWAAFGAAIARFLHAPCARKAFNGSMAALLVLSLVPVFW